MKGNVVLASHVATSAQGKISGYDSGAKANVTVDGTKYPLHANIMTASENSTANTGLSFNYNDSTSRICTGAAALGEVQEAIERYRDELELNISLYGLSGTFSIKKYSFDHSDTLFDFLERIGFPKEYDSPMDFDLNYYTAPKTDVFTEEVDQTLHLNFSVIGTGLQMAVVESLPV